MSTSAPPSSASRAPPAGPVAIFTTGCPERATVCATRAGGEAGQRTSLAVHPDQRLIELSEDQPLGIVAGQGSVSRVHRVGDGEPDGVARRRATRCERTGGVPGRRSGWRERKLRAGRACTAGGREENNGNDVAVSGKHESRDPGGG